MKKCLTVLGTVHVGVKLYCLQGYLFPCGKYDHLYIFTRIFTATLVCHFFRYVLARKLNENTDSTFCKLVFQTAIYNVFSIPTLRHRRLSFDQINCANDYNVYVWTLLLIFDFPTYNLICYQFTG